MKQHSNPRSPRKKPVTSRLTLEALWKEVGFQPNDSQRKAIEAMGGPLYLTAGPGSGKTRVLLWRTVNLIVFHEVDPAAIFLGTFTEKGAHQLREGLRGLLAIVTEKTGRPFDISAMAVGTIHSICHRLLSDRRLSQGGIRPRAPILLDELSQHLFVYNRRNWDRLMAAGGLGGDAAQVITGYFADRPSRSRHDAAVALISLFNRCSEESIGVDAARRKRDDVLRALLAMYGEYRVMLSEDPEREMTDLSLVQEHAYRRLCASPQGRSLFRHVIVDEYQDTNAIQEKIYFHLAGESKNLCVVGDDDQSLYRFRGATVDNFLAFPERCRELLGRKATQIPLVKNYRSRAAIVNFYNRFMGEFTWKERGTSYRVDKTIQAHSQDRGAAVFRAEPDRPDAVAAEVARVVKRLIDEKRVHDPSEIAFLFPSLKAAAVPRMRKALEDQGLKVYAPRAGSFLDVPEALQVFGLFGLIFDTAEAGHPRCAEWLQRADDNARKLVRKDRALAQFIKDRQADVKDVVANEQRLLAAVSDAGFSEQEPYDEQAGRVMQKARGVPTRVRAFLAGRSLSAYIQHQRERRPERPITIRYVINRACSLDWGLLDLFYQLTTFDVFKAAFDQAETGEDEGPICNLSLISDYLARFQAETSPVITGQFLSGGWFSKKFFGSYLYSIFRLGQSEYEDKEDPFPKGRIPFLTIHQAKGLEFTVVVLGNLRKDNNGPRRMDEVIAELGIKRREPLDIAPGFDIARTFYVALSRPTQLLILCPYKGPGQRINAEFRGPMESLARPLSSLDSRKIDPDWTSGQGVVPRPYSFTGDYISYKICPRRYMIYRRYNFVPARGQTAMFGNLVHQTIEDLHQWLIHERNGQRSLKRGARS